MEFENQNIEAVTKLKPLLTAGEAIYRIPRMCAREIYVIGPDVQDIGRQLDLAGCIEDTLHRLLDSDAGEDGVFLVLSAEQVQECAEEEGDYWIDLGYAILEFNPVHPVEKVWIYTRPMHMFLAYPVIGSEEDDEGQSILCLPEDPTDDEVLEAAKETLCIDPETYLPTDTGNGYLLHAFVKGDPSYVLSRCT